MRHTKNKIKLDKYSRKWVALLRDRVVEDGKTLNSLMKKMEKKGIKEKACIFCVPKKGKLIHYL